MASAGVFRHLWSCGRGVRLHLAGVAADPAQCRPDGPHDGVRRLLHLPPVRLRDLPHSHQGPGEFICSLHTEKYVFTLEILNIVLSLSGRRAD